MAQKADVLRLALLYYEGGVYLDTDVEPVKSIAPLYSFSSSMLVCHETKDQVGTAFIAARANSPLLRVMLDRIPDQLALRVPIYLQTGPGLVTSVLKQKSDATVSVLHSSYFYPVPYGSCSHQADQLVREARNPLARTIGIHRWA
jgi:mannosyltransferase OCH1-like enzyme